MEIPMRHFPGHNRQNRFNATSPALQVENFNKKDPAEIFSAGSVGNSYKPLSFLHDRGEIRRRKATRDHRPRFVFFRTSK